MARSALMAGLLLAGLTLGARATPAEEIKVETLTPRPGVTLPMLVLRADKPVASVVLFAGGDGTSWAAFEPTAPRPSAGTSWCARGQCSSARV
jgi:hypothetical protein